VIENDSWGTQTLDLNYDGMIIETHIDPDNAWSDAAQASDSGWNKFLLIWK
jgi:3-deoxy-D-manno-octulosonic acid (KDO) 8-phosphate synthase